MEEVTSCDWSLLTEWVDARRKKTDGKGKDREGGTSLIAAREKSLPHLREPGNEQSVPAPGSVAKAETEGMNASKRHERGVDQILFLSNSPPPPRCPGAADLSP